jgi:hypothetical protein
MKGRFLLGAGLGRGEVGRHLRLRARICVSVDRPSITFGFTRRDYGRVTLRCILPATGYGACSSDAQATFMAESTLSLNGAQHGSLNSPGRHRICRCHGARLPDDDYAALSLRRWPGAASSEAIKVVEKFDLAAHERVPLDCRQVGKRVREVFASRHVHHGARILATC